MQHFVRVGALGHIGRFTCVDSACYPRGARIVCRTDRGLELGEVLAPVRGACDEALTDGVVLRGMTPQDELLWLRLEKNRHSAFEACRAALAQRGLTAVLMDVEQLLDGQSLCFYFLGDITAEVGSVTHQLAEAYETKAQLRKFADTLIQGCGPDCGTDRAEKGGCGSSCGSCAAVGCAVRQASTQR